MTDPTIPAANSQVTEFRYCALPFDHASAGHFSIWVRRFEGDDWIVTDGPNGMGAYLTAEGVWVLGAARGETSEVWRSRTRFDLETAGRLAREAAPKMEANGFTVGYWLAKIAAKEAGR